MNCPEYLTSVYYFADGLVVGDNILILCSSSSNSSTRLLIDSMTSVIYVSSGDILFGEIIGIFSPIVSDSTTSLPNILTYHVTIAMSSMNSTVGAARLLIRLSR